MSNLTVKISISVKYQCVFPEFAACWQTKITGSLVRGLCFVL